MTTFQDPPPQSRRAVRQSERGETPEQVSVEQVETQPYSFDAAQEQASAPTAPSATPRTGRRVQLDAGASGPVEDRQAQVVPTGEAYSPQPPGDQEPPAQSVFRVRDFSPEGRRSSASRDQFQNVVSTPAPSAAEDHEGVATPVRSHSAAVPVDLEAGLSHTLTRRELREIRAAQQEQAPALALPEPIDTLLNSGPIEIPTLAPAPGQSQALADAMAEFDQLTRSRRDSEARARDLQVASLSAAKPAIPVIAPPPVAAASVPVAPALIEPSPTGPAPVQWSPPPPTGPSVPQAPPVAVEAAAAKTDAAEDAIAEDATVEVVAAEATAAEATVVETVAVENVVVDDAVVETAAVQPPLVESDAEADVDPVSGEPINAAARPAGHWSIQAALEDDETPFENTLSRTVGTGTSAITTSALVLPSVPQASDLTRPFASTGEILMTGSIDLPHSLGSTGAHPHRIDNSDFEDDPLDSQIAAPDSAPVRAIRAVSTHTSTRGVIENKKPQNNRWLTRVIIGVSTLLVVGVGLLVYVLVTHTY
jgi:hypothetical protein